MQANSYDNPGDQGGNLESIHDKLTILEPEGTPFVSMVKKTTAKATFTEAVADTLRKPRIKGSREGKSGVGGNNKAKDRQRFGNYCHRWFDEFGVTDVQQDVTKKGGNAVIDNEYGEAKAKTMREAKRDMEAICLSNQEMQGGSDDDMLTRGFFKWVQSAAQTVNPVPEKFRPPAASILSGIGTSLPLTTENALNQVLKSIKQVYGEKRTLNLLGGDDIIDTVDRFSRVNDSSTNVRYQVTEPSGSKKISLMVTIFDTSFARLEMMSDQFVRFNETTQLGETNAAAIVNPELWELQFLEEMVTRDMDDAGGGPWGWMRCKFANMCNNPRGQGAIYNT